ncbi:MULTISPECIES: metal/formaldehyde-sensitive transcriptional repressor [Chromobacterium]|uniref:Metal/formaldehyde-sensitive transcriptional repressor n=2 Tax=Chromobacterium TaxID=535 RepID=A0A1W0D861_9NEIS|nr:MULTISPECIES: metal/formaldehyde-sensitive transcriptional repressor [Chromobacterium]AXT46470.1 metal/formaldehyde-sensitive transcriptional repressor [Chromobacterium rhizoryzae]MBK0413220.1 metal/formaldehyde-sensitive transcriptional repressor [Chromobacterium haemolyticum]MBO0414322.1 metal/formaldehyde-sensitive transcriptional repressor [Chromobacterium haemolyticum]MBO0497819.1 metal/formaldehyde-sensitive transcriptional repressor [Chromobacterium haemolyticum]OQS40464.1 hypothetic
MPHTVKDKKKLLTRVRRIKGQAEALERALEQEVDCSAILQQIAAVRGAVNGLMMEVIEGHLREHLGPEAVDPAQRGKDLEQVTSVLRSYLK